MRAGSAAPAFIADAGPVDVDIAAVPGGAPLWRQRLVLPCSPAACGSVSEARGEARGERGRCLSRLTRLTPRL
eukprot:gene437-19210_t